MGAAADSRPRAAERSSIVSTRGLLHRLHPGVYSWGAAVESPWMRARAAMFACGHGFCACARTPCAASSASDASPRRDRRRRHRSPRRRTDRRISRAHGARSPRRALRPRHRHHLAGACPPGGGARTRSKPARRCCRAGAGEAPHHKTRPRRDASTGPAPGRGSRPSARCSTSRRSRGRRPSAGSSPFCALPACRSRCSTGSPRDTRSTFSGAMSGSCSSSTPTRSTRRGGRWYATASARRRSSVRATSCCGRPGPS